ncbi:Beta-barrel assembly machine subunit BamA [Rhizobiales bacterium GAS113]|nr:Beta-barrel assembly machine subunit BamA [Rhizobiales bacterium GAS113]
MFDWALLRLPAFRMAAFAAALLSGGLPAFAQQVIVRGNANVDPEAVKPYVSREGRLLDPASAQAELDKAGFFPGAKVTRQGSNLVVTISAKAQISRVVFEGNSKLKTDTLETTVLSKTRGPFSQSVVDADVQRIKDLYRTQGRGHAIVSERTVNLPDGKVDVVFTVKEGEKTGLKEIKFIGNNAVSNWRLKNIMTTTESNWLSFFKTSDIYDPDRIAADLEQIRRYYLKNGYADFRVVSQEAVFDEARGGWVLTVVLDEGEPYRIGDVRVESHIPSIDGDQLRRVVRTSTGDLYNAELVEKSVQALTSQVGAKGYAFGQARPVGTRDPATHTVSIGYIVEEGPRVFVERIDIKANTRTHDDVIRREIDLSEGDAYNKVLMDRAERRLNNLGYFKKVAVTTEPGSTPDRIVVVVNAEDQPTGAFAVSGGYSTSDGIIGEVSVTESNFLGRGLYVKVSGSLGQRTNGVEFSFTNPYFLGQRLAAGFDLFTKYQDNTRYALYTSRTTGGQIRLGFPLTEEWTFIARYALYSTDIKIPNTTTQPFNDCTSPIPGVTLVNPDGTTNLTSCTANGEASIALKQSKGSRLTSAPGYTFDYNTVDNVKDPHAGIFAEVKQDFAGLGGDSKWVRTTGVAKYYYEMYEDVVGLFKLQGGYLWGYGGNNKLKITDNFNLGPEIVRGFAPQGIGPRDLNGDFKNNPLGGTTYFGGSFEVQFPIWGIPREIGLKGALFADAGTLFGYRGQKYFPGFYGGTLANPVNCNPPVSFAQITATQVSECVNVHDSHMIRSSVGGSILWNSPLGPIRFDLAYATTKDKYDRLQVFRFSGGGSF